MRYATVLAAMLVGVAALFSSAGCKQSGPKRQALYVACSSGSHVLVYEIDRETGRLDEVQRVETPGPAGPIALSPDERTLYVTLNQPARVMPMSRDTATGELAMLEPTVVPAHPTYLDIDATGRFAVTASYRDGVVNTFGINDDHTLAEGPIQTTVTAANAHACLIDPSNRFVYIPHTGPNAIYQFRFHDKTGKLAPIQPLVVPGGGSFEALAGPRHYCYHPTLGVVYVVNELDSSVTAYAWDRQTGRIEAFQNLTTLPEDFRERNTCADIHVTPDGRFLYASNRGHNSIAAYALDKRTGMMSFIDRFPTEPIPREFAIDLTGRYLYAAGQQSGKLAAYTIDSYTGRLTRIGTYDTPAEPLWVEAVGLD